MDFQLISSHELISANEFEQNLKYSAIIAQALEDLIRVFFLEKGIQFDFYYFDDEPKKITEHITNKILSNNNEKYKYNIIIDDKLKSENRIIFHPVIIYIETSHNLYTFIENFKVCRNENEPIVNFIYIEEHLMNDFDIIIEYNMPLTLETSTILQYLYFVINYSDKIEVKTFEWFIKPLCNYPVLMRLNVFHKTSKTWERKLKYYEKFLNYNGCGLVLMLPHIKGYYDRHVWGYVRVNYIINNFNKFGIIPKIFEICAKKFNFKDDYQPVWPLTNESLLDAGIGRKTVETIFINGTSKELNVYFEVVSSTSLAFSSRVRMTLPFISVSRVFLVTPAEAYSAYEKLLLPFDRETWILLLITFSIAFFTIFIINKLSRIFQELIYGKRVMTPTLNIVSIFFGISLTRMPNGNFSRQILIFFIYFCLIFRTCFQSKMFEFMTSNPRRSPPKSIDDLINRDYTVYTLQNDSIFMTVEPSQGKKM